MHGNAIRAAAAITCLALSACHPARIGQGRNRADRPVTVKARLDCPERVGDLSRAAAATDGLSCRYSGPDLMTVELKRVPLSGLTPQAALAPVEAEIEGWTAQTAPGSAAHHTKDADDKAEGRDDHDKSDSVTHLRLPGLVLDAGPAGAHVHALGHDIDASDSGAVINGSWNGRHTQITAGDGGVDLRSGWIGVHALDLFHLRSSSGRHPGSAAYVARGPVAGPLVVAVMHAPGGEHRRGAADGDMRRLVDRNVDP